MKNTARRNAIIWAPVGLMAIACTLPSTLDNYGEMEDEATGQSSQAITADASAPRVVDTSAEPTSDKERARLAPPVSILTDEEEWYTGSVATLGAGTCWTGGETSLGSTPLVRRTWWSSARVVGHIRATSLHL
jgi:hypothetical protein